MLLNPEIKPILSSFNIPVNDGLAYLLSVYYDVQPSYIPEAVIKKINIARIIVLDEKSKTLIWNIPLFEEQVTGFEWVNQWIEEFAHINKERKGTYKNVAARMKKFFINNPSVRMDDVIGATRMYFRTVTNPKYLKSADKFIYEGLGAEKISLLLQWVETYKSLEVSDNGRTSFNNTMS